jgi:hypothetical protein
MMEWLSDLTGLDRQPLILAGLLAGLGALLGGAVAHWRRGSGMIVTGAIIGAVALPLIGLATFFYAIYAGAIVLIGLVILVIGSILG